MAQPRLTYFSSRGRAELVRLILAEAGVGYEEVRVGVFHPTEKTPEFLAVKGSGKLAFDALPLWEEVDGFSLVQSGAIVRHLARTRGLYGANDSEAARCDMILEGIQDTRDPIMKLASCEPAKRAELRAGITSTTLPRWLGYFNRILESNPACSGFFVGAGVTCADVAFYQLLEALIDNELAAPLDALPLLQAFKQRMEDRPGLGRYIKSPDRFPAQLLPK